MSPPKMGVPCGGLAASSHKRRSKGTKAFRRSHSTPDARVLVVGTRWRWRLVVMVVMLAGFFFILCGYICGSFMMCCFLVPIVFNTNIKYLVFMIQRIQQQRRRQQRRRRRRRRRRRQTMKDNNNNKAQQHILTKTSDKKNTPCHIIFETQYPITDILIHAIHSDSRLSYMCQENVGIAISMDINKLDLD